MPYLTMCDETKYTTRIKEGEKLFSSAMVLIPLICASATLSASSRVHIAVCAMTSVATARLITPEST